MVVDQSELEVPEQATVSGLTVEIVRAGDEKVADDSIKIMKADPIGDTERALPDAWTSELGWVTYGGEDDLAEDFGAFRPLRSAGWKCSCTFDFCVSSGA